jgi:hypothetical protein
MYASPSLVAGADSLVGPMIFVVVGLELEMSEDWFVRCLVHPESRYQQLALISLELQARTILSTSALSSFLGFLLLLFSLKALKQMSQ